MGLMQERKCARCGVPFIPKRGNHIYHSKTCGNAVTAEGRRTKAHDVTCDVCGAEFQTTNPSTRRCQPPADCARTYRAEYHRRRERIPSRPKGALGWEEVFSWRYTESN